MYFAARLSLVLSATISILSVSNQVCLAADEGQNAYRAPTSFAGKTVVLPIGTTFEGRIQQTIGSSISSPGASFSIEVSAPVMANGTEVLIPTGAQVNGEVAEAISSQSQPKDKNKKYHPLGKLRVQLSSLKMPDGMSYPLVGSFAPDSNGSRSRGDMSVRKSSVAYVGTQAGFDAVNPANPNSGRRNTRNNGVLGKSDIMRDPILGENNAGSQNTHGAIRALVKRGRDLVIMSGSSITIRLDGPLKLAFGTSNAQTSMDNMAEEAPAKGGKAKHFNKHRSKNKQEDADNDGGGQQMTNNAQQGQSQQQVQQQGQAQGQTLTAPGSDF
jgi:hypothetical protein